MVPVKLFLEFKMHVTWAKLEDLDYSVTESDQVGGVVWCSVV